MKVVALKAPAGLDNLVLEERPDPVPGPGEILVKVHASSLNYHDYVVCSGGIPTADRRVPLSDASGTVIDVGDGVREFREGDKVVSTFFPNWQHGRPEYEKLRGVPGDHVDGFAAEMVARPATAFTLAPSYLTLEEAATVPCAGVTAFRGMFVEGSVGKEDWVLTMGTGGVSIFALQFAKGVGAKVIATTSSDDKVQRLIDLGADHVINYKTTPDWGKKARELTGGIGVDEVVEIGGPGTLRQSISATRVGGHISMIGVLTGVAGEVPTASLLLANLTMSGITVGSRADQSALIRGSADKGQHPVIDREFPMEDLAAAFRYQESGQHFGKIVIRM